jgi:hypothetical protein
LSTLGVSRAHFRTRTVGDCIDGDVSTLESLRTIRFISNAKLNFLSRCYEQHAMRRVGGGSFENNTIAKLSKSKTSMSSILRPETAHLGA